MSERNQSEMYYKDGTLSEVITEITQGKHICRQSKESYSSNDEMP